MDRNHQADDFDDFFDTPGRSLMESTELDTLDTPEEKVIVSKSGRTSTSQRVTSPLSDDRSKKMSSADHHHNHDLESSVTNSTSTHSMTGSRNQKQRKSRSSSRSESSDNSESHDGSISEYETSKVKDKNSGMRLSSDTSHSVSKKNDHVGVTVSGKIKRLSQSSSQSRSDSRSSSDSETRRKGRNRSRDSYSSVTSSSTYSRGHGHGKEANHPQSHSQSSSQSSSDSRSTTPDSLSRGKVKNRPTDKGKKRNLSRSRSSSRSTSSDFCTTTPDSVSRRKERNRSTDRGRRGNLSRSRSSSQSRSSDSRTTSPDSVSRGKGRKKQTDSCSFLRTYTQEKHSGLHTPRPKPRQEDERHQAWNTESKSNNRSFRPKTATQHTSARDYVSHSHEHQGKHSPVNSDSDMTDVSPIMSPRNGPINRHRKDGGDSYVTNPKKFQAIPLDRDDKFRCIFDGGDSSALDLNILMKAVSELEKQKRVDSNTRRVMFEPQRARPHDKSNFTFSNDDTHKIELENKRLLRQIMHQVHPEEEKQPKMTDIKKKQAVITASAINRRRQQQQIESKNLAFLKRLQRVQASKGLSRNEQLSAYNSTVLHGIPMAALHPTKTSGLHSGHRSRASSAAGNLSRTRSLTSLHSVATASSFSTTTSRQSSRASSRPSSAKKSVQDRPAWDDRW